MGYEKGLIESGGDHESRDNEKGAMMNKIIMLSLVIPMLFLHYPCTPAFSSVLGQQGGGSASCCAKDSSADKAQRYIRAYPGFFAAYENGNLVTKDGRRIPFEDGRPKDLGRMVEDSTVGDDAFDPGDALYWSYPAGRDIPTSVNPPLGDPGRIRPEELFHFMYGSSKSERKGRMRDVEWVGTINGKSKKIRMTTVNGVDKALERVSREIMNLPEDKKPCLEGIVYNVDGPYGYFERHVRDFPRRTSGHAYGIAVDINGDIAYFNGSHGGEPYLYRNNVPQFLVQIFERNGFIWGGRWHSYDAMHFEYRPELLMNGQSSMKAGPASSANCSR